MTASNVPPSYPATVYKGSLWHVAFPILNSKGEPVSDTAGLTGRAQIRQRAADPVPLYDFTDIVINPEDKTVELRVPGADSAGWTWRAGLLEVEVLDASGEPHTIAAGPVRTRENIAR